MGKKWRYKGSREPTGVTGEGPQEESPGTLNRVTCEAGSTVAWWLTVFKCTQTMRFQALEVTAVFLVNPKTYVTPEHLFSLAHLPTFHRRHFSERQVSIENYHEDEENVK